jgi:valyl-tRNA synthetase
VSRPRVEGNRNFVTKIWNAARFVLSQSPHPPAPSPSRGEGEYEVSPLPHTGRRALCVLEGEGRSLADRWIVSRLNRLIADATRLIEDYQFGEAGRQIYEFFWGEYCDWYLEIAKILLRAADERGDGAARTATLSTLVSVLECALRLLHPYMPFVTEEIYQQIPGHGEALIIAPWPEALARDEAAERAMGVVMELIGGIRTARAELNIEPRRKLPAIVMAPAHLALLEGQRAVVEALAGLDGLALRGEPGVIPTQALHLAFPDLEAYLPLEGVVDVAAERARAQSEIARVERTLAGLRGRLSNPDFTARAPAAVVEKERARRSENEELLQRLRARLRALS